MSVPGPEEMRRKAEAMKRDLDRLVTEYRWLYGAAYGSGGRGGGRSGKGESNPTEAALLAEHRARFRGRLEEAARLIGDEKRGTQATVRMAAAIVTVTYRMRDVLGAPEPPGRPLAKGQLEESMAMKRKREGRGEGWGEG